MRRLALLIAGLAVASCGGTPPSSPTPATSTATTAASTPAVTTPPAVTPPTATVSSIAVSTPTSSSFIAGNTTQLSATATLSDGTKQDVTTLASWQSMNTAVATVSAGGLVTAISAGTTTITATYQTVSSATPIPVSAATDLKPTLAFTFSGGSNCTAPCALFFTAQASDPSGLPISYNWTGCSGVWQATSAPNLGGCWTQCPTTATFTVVATDSAGRSATASIVGSTNAAPPPTVTLGRPTSLGGNVLEAFGDITESITPTQVCGGGFSACPYIDSISMSGSCTSGASASCGCIEGGLDAEFHSTASSGTCTATFQVHDICGVPGTSAVTFTIPTPTFLDVTARAFFSDPTRWLTTAKKK